MTTQPAATDRGSGDAVEAAEHRSTVFGFLAAVFRKEPTSALIRQIREPRFAGALAAAGIELGREFFDLPETELVDRLAVEYAALFIGPGKHIPPYASVHFTDGDGELWTASTVRVKRLIESEGFAYKSDFRDLPDHISAELEFMRMLTAREANALRRSDDSEAASQRDAQQRFLRDHMAPWIPRFCRKVVGGAEMCFYREMADFMKDFIGSEMKHPRTP